MIGIAIGLTAGRLRWRISQAPLDSERVAILKWRAPAADAGSIMIIGDSLTERNPVTSLCGRPVFNAGVSRATVGDLDAIAGDLTTAARPVATIIAAGTNDAQSDTPIDDFRRMYRSLLRKGARPVGLVGVSDIPGFSGRVRAVNAVIRDAARGTGADYIAPLSSTSPGMVLSDGIHHTPRGAREWRRRLSAACVSELPRPSLDQ